MPDGPVRVTRVGYLINRMNSSRVWMVVDVTVSDRGGQGSAPTVSNCQCPRNGARNRGRETSLVRHSHDFLPQQAVPVPGTRVDDWSNLDVGLSSLAIAWIR